MCGGAVQPWEEKGDTLKELFSQSFSDNGVCRKAPGFDQVCLIFCVYPNLLDGVDPIDNKPSTNKAAPLCPKKKKKRNKYVTCDM